MVVDWRGVLRFDHGDFRFAVVMQWVNASAFDLCR